VVRTTIEEEITMPTTQELREKAKQKSPFMLQSELPEELETTKLEYERPDGSYGKQTVYVTKGASVEHILFCLKEFMEAARRRNWQGQERFEKYRDTLVGNAKVEWDSARTQVPNLYNLEVFNQQVRVMISQKCGRKSYDNFIKYLQTVKKPMTMEPEQVAMRVQTLSGYMQWLTREGGNAAPTLTELEQRTYFVNLMPDSWIEAFEKANMHVEATTMGNLIEYFKTLQSHEVTRKSATTKTKRSDDDAETSNKRARYSSSRRYGGSGRYYSRSGRSGRGSHRGRSSGRSGRGGRGRDRGTRRPEAQDHCPLHPDGVHTWGDCSQNPRSVNYGMYGQGRGNGGRGGRGGQGNYYVQRDGNANNTNPNVANQNARNNNNANAQPAGRANEQQPAGNNYYLGAPAGVDQMDPFRR
jgi:hypothetical protein